MLSLLADIIAHFQWPKIRKEIRRLMPKTLALAERMENELVSAVKQEGNLAIGVDIHYVNPKDGKVLASLYELKVLMEQHARKSLGMSCYKKFKKDFSVITIPQVETLCDEILSERQIDACVPHPLITMSPSFFITGNTIEDPWFLFVPGRKIPKMVGD